ncbi:MAG: hypothetical protein JW929_12505 [Anaerolineales bacterium]|nr:hypothetical protein [Anaerolineales bacterium]
MNEEVPAGNSAQGPACRPILFNILSIFFLVLSCLCPAFSVLIFAAPDSALNPLRPADPATAVPPQTPTPTELIQFPPTWTPIATLTHTATRAQLTASDTSVYNLNPDQTPGQFFPFVVEGVNPSYSASPKGCNWLGVAGMVYDLNREPFNNLIVQIHGVLGGETIDEEQVTGSLGEDRAGEFEFQLAGKPILSLNSMWIMLMDGNRTPISDKIVFNTYAGCDKNLITVNFIRINP